MYHALVVASNGRQQCSDVPVDEAVLRNPRPTLIGWGQRHLMGLGSGICIAGHLLARTARSMTPSRYVNTVRQVKYRRSTIFNIVLLELKFQYFRPLNKPRGNTSWAPQPSQPLHQPNRVPQTSFNVGSSRRKTRLLSPGHGRRNLALRACRVLLQPDMPRITSVR